MTTVLVALVLVAVVVTLVVGATWAFRRRAIEREHRRVAALTSLADRLGDLTAALDAPSAVPERSPRAPGPLPPTESRGRTALLDALADAVAHARADGSRLAVAVVESRSTMAPALADEVGGVTGGEAYEVGSRAVALVVPGVGRADALGLLARIQASCGATGNAVELEPGESALELHARVLGSVSAGD